MLRTVAATRYVTPLREGGSLPGLVEADDDGLYVVKFRAAGQGLKALVAELSSAGCAPPGCRSRSSCCRASIRRSAAPSPTPRSASSSRRAPAATSGSTSCPGRSSTRPPGRTVRAEFAADVVWFDALVTNVDRTARNPNLIVWHGRTWLIDHGAALYRHHARTRSRRGRASRSR